MPNIRKLVLVMRKNLNLNSCQSAFSKWKYLQTLIIAPYLPRENDSSLELQAIGNNCRNLTNTKFIVVLDKYVASNIICYLPILEKISFQYSSVSREAAISLIIGHPKLKILNLSHCLFMQLDVNGKTNILSNMKPKEELVKIGTEKLEKFIVCCSDCPICPDVWKYTINQRFTLDSRNFWKKHWKSDEIKEFGF